MGRQQEGRMGSTHGVVSWRWMRNEDAADDAAAAVALRAELQIMDTAAGPR